MPMTSFSPLGENLFGEPIQAPVGMDLYNDAILITTTGNLALRVGRQFETSRKLGKTHQNVLVFAKGNPRDSVWSATT